MDQNDEIIEEKNEELSTNENLPQKDEEESIIEESKKFSILTMIALGSVALFMIFFFIDYLNYRWWIMLPLAFVSALSSFLQLRNSKGLEKKVCWIVFILIVSLFVIRDIDLSSGMANFYDGIKNFAKALKHP